MASELALLGRVTGMLSGQSMNLYVERHSVAAHQRQLSSGGEGLALLHTVTTMDDYWAAALALDQCLPPSLPAAPGR